MGGVAHFLGFCAVLSIIKPLKLEFEKHYLPSWDRLADLAGRDAFASTVIGCDSKIVRSSHGQTVHGGRCNATNSNCSCIEAWCFTNIDFIACHGCSSDCVPRESSRRRCPTTSTAWRRYNQRHRDCSSEPGALLDCDRCPVGPCCTPSDIDSNRDGRTCGLRLAGG